MQTAQDHALAFLIGCIFGSIALATPVPPFIVGLAFFAVLCRWLMAAYDARGGK